MQDIIVSILIVMFTYEITQLKWSQKLSFAVIIGWLSSMHYLFQNKTDIQIFFGANPETSFWLVIATWIVLPCFCFVVIKFTRSE